MEHETSNFSYETLTPIGTSENDAGLLHGTVGLNSLLATGTDTAAASLRGESSLVNRETHLVYSVASSIGDGLAETHFLDGMESEKEDMASVVFRRVIDESDTEGFSLSERKDDGAEIEYLSLNLLDEADAEMVPCVADSPTTEKTECLIPGAVEVPLRDQAIPPWARTGDKRGNWVRSPLLQLHQEIVDFCVFVSPTYEEQQERTTAIQRVTNVIESIWPISKVKVFGSFETGLYLPTSDIDMVILDSGCEDAQSGLKALAKALSKKSIGKNLQVIAKARVPIIKFVEKESDISFDISFDLENGPQAAEFIKEAMMALPPLKPLCLVLKIFLQQRELNEVYTGGLGSYMLLVMLLTHLQMHPSRRNYSSSGGSSALECNLGILLVDFFDLYGRTLNVKEVGISCRQGGGFFKKKSRGFLDLKRSHLMSVEDPQTPDNDLGRNSFNMQKVRTAFMTAHRVLTTVDSEEDPMRTGLLVRIVRMDEKLVGRRMALSSPDPGSRHGFSHLGASELERWQTDGEVDGEVDFPRGDVETENIPQMGVKRKRGQRGGGHGRGGENPTAEKTRKHNKHFKQHWVHSKEKFKGQGRRPSKDQGSMGSNLKGRLKKTCKQYEAGNNLKFAHSHEKIETQHRTFRGKQRRYNNSETSSHWTGKRSAMGAKIGRGQGITHMDSIENRERPLNSTMRRVITSSAHKKIKYF